MSLAELVNRGQVVADLKASGKLEVLDELSFLLSRGNVQISPGDLCRVLTDRERLRSTGVGSGVAIPHGRVPGLKKLTLAVAISQRGVNFGAIDGEPVHVFVAIATPVTSTGDHLKILAQIAKLCANTEIRERLRACVTDEELYRAIVTEDSKQYDESSSRKRQVY